MISLDREKEKYIKTLFSGYCPFCLSRNPNWKGKNKIFSRRFIFHCSNCCAEISFEKSDIESQNYKNLTVVVEDAQNNERYQWLQWKKVRFQEFYSKCILSQHHHAVKHIEGTGFPDSCRVCDHGKNQENDVTWCTKFEIRCSSNSICDSYTDEEWQKTTDMYLDALFKGK